MSRRQPQSVDLYPRGQSTRPVESPKAALSDQSERRHRASFNIAPNRTSAWLHRQSSLPVHMPVPAILTGFEESQYLSGRCGGRPVDAIADGRTPTQNLRRNKNGRRAYASGRRCLSLSEPSSERLFLRSISCAPGHHHFHTSPGDSVSGRTLPVSAGLRRLPCVSVRLRGPPSRAPVPWSPPLSSVRQRRDNQASVGYEVAASMCSRCNLNGPPGESDRAEVRAASRRRNGGGHVSLRRTEPHRAAPSRGESCRDQADGEPIKTGFVACWYGGGGGGSSVSTAGDMRNTTAGGVDALLQGTHITNNCICIARNTHSGSS